MNKEKKEIGYDQYMPLPLQERLEIFNEISAENRALLVKTQVERWLAKNRPQLTQAQIEILDEAIGLITPDKYREDKDTDKVEQEAEKFSKRMEKLFSRDEMRQIVSERASYIPPTDAEKR